MGECSLADNCNAICAKLFFSKLALKRRRNCHKLLSVCRKNYGTVLCRESRVALFYYELVNGCFPESKLADVIDVFSDSYFLKRLALVEHTCRDNGSIDAE